MDFSHFSRLLSSRRAHLSLVGVSWKHLLEAELALPWQLLLESSTFSWEHLMEGTCGAVKNRFPFVSLLSASVAAAWSGAASVTSQHSRNALLLCDFWGEKQVGLLCNGEFSAVVPTMHPSTFSLASYEVSMSPRLFSFSVHLVRTWKLTRYFSGRNTSWNTLFYFFPCAIHKSPSSPLTQFLSRGNPGLWTVVVRITAAKDQDIFRSEAACCNLPSWYPLQKRAKAGLGPAQL